MDEPPCHLRAVQPGSAQERGRSRRPPSLPHGDDSLNAESPAVRSARKAALRRATASLERLLPDELEREAHADAVDRYANAVALVARLREEWERLGAPLLGEGSMRQPVKHQVLKMIEEAERDAARYGEAVGIAAPKVARKQGRPTGQVSAPDRAAPQRIRRVK